jgi:hypothetical protein
MTSDARTTINIYIPNRRKKWMRRVKCTNITNVDHGATFGKNNEKKHSSTSPVTRETAASLRHCSWSPSSRSPPS